MPSSQRGTVSARLETPAGAVDVDLGVTADADTGVVDWHLAFPDGSVGIAQSRVTETTRGTCIYSFVLHAPPVALEQVEGALEAPTGTSAVGAGDTEIADATVTIMPRTLEDLARQAIGGDRDALDLPRQSAPGRRLRPGSPHAVESRGCRGCHAGNPGANRHATGAVRFPQQA